MAGVWWGRDEDSVRRRPAPAHMVATRRALLVLFVIAAARGEPLPPRRIHVRTRVGCSPRVELSLQPSPAADVWVRPDDDIGLPRNSVFLCGGSAIDHLPHGGWKTVPGTGLAVCAKPTVQVEMQPEKAQAGSNFTIRVAWELALAGKQPTAHPGNPDQEGTNVAAVDSTEVTFEVVPSQPHWAGSAGSGGEVAAAAAPAGSHPAVGASSSLPGVGGGSIGVASYVIHVGCEASIPLEAFDAGEPVSCSNISSSASPASLFLDHSEASLQSACEPGCPAAAYELDIAPIPHGNAPPTETGLPEGVRLPEGGVGGEATLVPTVDDTPAHRRLELQWVPQRGQERSTPYRICFSAGDR